jgi:hypothetical protein
VSGGSFKVYLANLVSSPDDIAESAKHSEDYIQVKATFFDPEVEIEALRKEKITIDTNTFAILIDNGVMFESVRPFLKTLSTIDSTSIPFSRYICAQDSLNNVEIRPPKYATAPGFRFKLQSVAKPGRRSTRSMSITPHLLLVLEPNYSNSVSWTQAKRIASWTL